jgi:hypothetical protein
MMPSLARSQERDKAGEIRLSELKEAKGDTAMAFMSLSEKTYLLLEKDRDCLDELNLAKTSIIRYKEYGGYNTKGWIEKSWDSDGMKVAIFIGGIWLGTRIVHAAN